MNNLKTTFIGVFFLTILISACNKDDIYPDSSRVIPEDYVPFVKEGKVWNYYNTSYYSSTGAFIEPGSHDMSHISCSFKIQGDTIIKNVPYKKVLMQGGIFDDDQWHYDGAIREHLMRVFFIEKSENSEEWVLDFGVNTGDKFTWNNSRWEVSSISSVSYSKLGKSYRMIQLIGISESALYDAETWIEGIGMESGIIPFHKGMQGGLHSCFDNDVCLYSSQALNSSPAEKRLSTEKDSR